MPRYFFHVRDGTVVLDEVGVELPDMASAQATAVQLSAEILKEGVIIPLWSDLQWRVEGSARPPPWGGRVFSLLNLINTAVEPLSCRR